METTPASPLIDIQALVILLLAIASFVGILTRRLRVPYTVGLVLVGLAISILRPLSIEITPDLVVQLADIQITPEIILGLLVPPLIYEAAFHLRYSDLRRNLIVILVFAVLGVILTTLLVGLVVTWGTEIALPAAIVFGAVVAAIDPVAVMALFRSIGVPKRLQVLLEGESLLNDGTAIVVYTLAVGVVMTGEFSIVESLTGFLREAGGGLVVGLGLGWAISLIFRRLDDRLIETTLTLVLAYSAYLLAQSLHVSGVLAVVAAGLVSGNLGPRAMTPTTRILVFNFWEIAAFLANSFAFLIIGIEIQISLLLANWEAITVAIVAVLVARAVVIYGLSWAGDNLPFAWNHVLFWGGLRGAISLALALSLPLDFGPDRGQIQAMVFGVVLFTLLVQGVSMEPLITRLKLIQRTESQIEYEVRHARVVAARSGYERVRRMHNEGLISDFTWEGLSTLLKEHVESLRDAVGEVMHANPQVDKEEIDTARREALRAQRSALTSLLNDGVISEEVYTQLVTEVDTALASRENDWARLVRPTVVDRPPANRLIAAIVQEQDAENTALALEALNVNTTRLPSIGGFLGRQNVTFLIGFQEGQEEVVVDTLRRSSRRRVEFVSSPMESLPFPLPRPNQVQVGGVTLFVFEIEDYQEF